MKLVLYAVLFAFLPICFPVQAAETDSGKTAIGVTVDFLPYLVSAADGKIGYSYQTWAGINHCRVRFVGAKIFMPQFLSETDRFEHHSMTVTAAIIDYTFGNHFDGFWIGSGFELWQNRITCKQTGDTLDWTNQVFTVGGGYIWKITDSFYLEPWAAAHSIVNRYRISSGKESYVPNRFSAEVSLKAGYLFSM